MITIEYADRDTGEIFPVRVSDYIHKKNNPYYMIVIDPDEIVIEKNEIRLLFDYPINKSVIMEFKQEKDFTRMDLFRCIYEGYEKIYADEDFYDVWGHAIDDLFIEGVLVTKEGHYRLAIGS